MSIIFIYFYFLFLLRLKSLDDLTPSRREYQQEYRDDGNDDEDEEDDPDGSVPAHPSTDSSELLLGNVEVAVDGADVARGVVQLLVLLDEAVDGVHPDLLGLLHKLVGLDETLDIVTLDAAGEVELLVNTHHGDVYKKKRYIQLYSIQLDFNSLVLFCCAFFK